MGLPSTTMAVTMGMMAMFLEMIMATTMEMMVMHPPMTTIMEMICGTFLDSLDNQELFLHPPMTMEMTTEMMAMLPPTTMAMTMEMMAMHPPMTTTMEMICGTFLDSLDNPELYQ